MTAARRTVPRTAPPRQATPRSSGGARRPAHAGTSVPAGIGRARWLRVALLVAAVLVGLPLAHALFGEVIALLGGAMLLGFLIGRWTAPGR